MKKMAGVTVNEEKGAVAVTEQGNQVSLQFTERPQGSDPLSLKQVGLELLAMSVHQYDWDKSQVVVSSSDGTMDKALKFARENNVVVRRSMTFSQAAAIMWLNKRASKVCVIQRSPEAFHASIFKRENGVIETVLECVEESAGYRAADELVALRLRDRFKDKTNIDLRHDEKAWDRLMKAALDARETLRTGFRCEVFLPFIAGNHHLEAHISRADYNEITGSVNVEMAHVLKKLRIDNKPLEMDVILLGNLAQDYVFRKFVMANTQVQETRLQIITESLAMGAALEAEWIHKVKDLRMPCMLAGFPDGIKPSVQALLAAHLLPVAHQFGTGIEMMPDNNFTSGMKSISSHMLQILEPLTEYVSELDDISIPELPAPTVQEFFMPIFPLMDDLDRGLNMLKEHEANAEDTEETSDEKHEISKQIAFYDWIMQDFTAALKSCQVTIMDTKNKAFDPYLHEAAQYNPDNAFGVNMVGKELRKGYFYRDNVIRHAVVEVTN